MLAVDNGMALVEQQAGQGRSSGGSDQTGQGLQWGTSPPAATSPTKKKGNAGKAIKEAQVCLLPNSSCTAQLHTAQGRTTGCSCRLRSDTHALPQEKARCTQSSAASCTRSCSGNKNQLLAHALH